MRDAWDAAYGPLLASQLEARRRYSILKVAGVEFAYTRYDHFAEALARAWELGLVPEPCPNAFGRDLPNAAPRLRGVDSDLGHLSLGELAAQAPPV